MQLSATKRLFIISLVTVFTSTGIAAEACSVPVFRYALERWHAEVYQVFIFHRGPPSLEVKEIKGLIDEAAEREAYANVRCGLRDLDKDDLEPSLKKMWISESDGKTPWMALLAPTRGRGRLRGRSESKTPEPIWSGKPAVESVEQILDSPKRRKIARQILNGKSAVLVFIPSQNDADENASKRKMLKIALNKGKEKAQLPQVANRDQRRYISENGPELKIDFSMVEVRRDDPAEEMFRRMMLQFASNEAKSHSGPLVVPVFGRGRMMTPLFGEYFKEKTVIRGLRYFASRCSCQVKYQHPGFDGLFTAGWQNYLPQEEELPKWEDRIRLVPGAGRE